MSREQSSPLSPHPPDRDLCWGVLSEGFPHIYRWVKLSGSPVLYAKAAGLPRRLTSHPQMFVWSSRSIEPDLLGAGYPVEVERTL